MNEKKRKTGKDKSCSQNSNQKHSVLFFNTVEGEEMVTMDYNGPTGGLDNDGERMDYLQVAWLLREKLTDLVDGDKGEFLGLGLRSLLNMASSYNIVSVDPKVLNPVLWRTLPKELLLFILARLPLPDITRLRCLSREWRKDMTIVNSEINLACHKASPTMVALLSGFSVRLYNIKKCSWQYIYDLHLRRLWNDNFVQEAWTAVDACDGGLVCFISLWKPTKHNRLCIIVVNLLTRVQHELPPLLYLYFALPTMVQIKVNFNTKCYQVVVMGCRKGDLTIEIYNSGTRQWTKSTPSCGSIFGSVHNWTTTKKGYHKLSTTLDATPGAYDFTKGKLEHYQKKPTFAKFVIDKVFEKNRMFVLQNQMQMDASYHEMVCNQSFCITEYHAENQTKDWIKGKSYECPIFEEKLFHLYLCACDSFLMLIVHPDLQRQYIWLLDLSTCEWSKLPETSKLLNLRGSMLCKAVWNMVP